MEFIDIFISCIRVSVFFCDINRNKNARNVYVMLEIPGFWHLLIHRRWLHLIIRAAEWGREAVWKQLSFFIKIFEIKKKKKKNQTFFSGSKHHRWVLWLGKSSERNLFIFSPWKSYCCLELDTALPCQTQVSAISSEQQGKFLAFILRL